LRFFWSIAICFVIVHLVPEPWSWIWVGAIWGMWMLVLGRAAFLFAIKDDY